MKPFKSHRRFADLSKGVWYSFIISNMHRSVAFPKLTDFQCRNSECHQFKDEYTFVNNRTGTWLSQKKRTGTWQSYGCLNVSYGIF
jgi:hypothetical protein